ncbi:diiron oxygenase [Pseudomonas sp. NPDC089395]|uniref:diiron oxygenase n=1 Tax=Pseudomonas sp. NPDC089395 TaxID=3364460 RepID=UPI0038066FE1
MKQQERIGRGVQVFETWNDTSAVRCRPYAYDLSAQDFMQVNPSLWFPTALIPLMGCSEVKVLPVENLRKIYAGHLLYFLDYTAELEVALVNKAVSCIVYGPLSKYFSASERSTALKLYADEGYHALFSKMMAEQVADFFELDRHRSARLKHFDRLLASDLNHNEELVLFVMAFISETIITRELALLVRDDLVSPVFHMLQDHLHDEAKHSVFFSDCFVTLWGKISDVEKDVVVKMLVIGFRIFCRPDIAFVRSQLEGKGFCSASIVSQLRQGWPSRAVSLLMLTMKAIRRTDLLANKSYLRQFEIEGLV